MMMMKSVLKDVVGCKGPSGSLLTEQTHSRKTGRRPASDKLHSSVTSHHYAIQLLHCTAQHHRGALWPAHTGRPDSLLRYFYKQACVLLFLFLFSSDTFLLWQCVWRSRRRCFHPISNLCWWRIKSAAHRRLKTTKASEQQDTQAINCFEFSQGQSTEKTASWKWRQVMLTLACRLTDFFFFAYSCSHVQKVFQWLYYYNKWQTKHLWC